MHKTTITTAPAFSALSLLRISIGFVYLWFGALKFFQGISPAEQLAMETIHKLVFGLFDERINIFLLACWECTIGILFILGKWMKPSLVLMLLHMACTFAPFIFFPSETFRYSPYGLSMTGQYIMKNIVFISAAIVLWQAEKERSKKCTRHKRPILEEQFFNKKNLKAEKALFQNDYK